MVKQKRSTYDAILRQNMSMALWQKRDCLNIPQRLCHTKTPKNQNCCFSWHHEWKRETIYQLNIFIRLLKDAIKWFSDDIPHYNNVIVFVRQVISFEMFVYYQYILQRFFVAKVIQQRKLVNLYSQPSSSKEHSNHSFGKSRRIDAYTWFIAN